jgi:hypothetical protein
MFLINGYELTALPIVYCRNIFTSKWTQDSRCMRCFGNIHDSSRKYEIHETERNACIKNLILMYREYAAFTIDAKFK